MYDEEVVKNYFKTPIQHHCEFNIKQKRHQTHKAFLICVFRIKRGRTKSKMIYFRCKSEPLAAGKQN